jgi:hypothetical protein
MNLACETSPGLSRLRRLPRKSAAVQRHLVWKATAQPPPFTVYSILLDERAWGFHLGLQLE